MGQCIEKLCKGDNVEFVNPLGNGENAKEQANAISKAFDLYEFCS